MGHACRPSRVLGRRSRKLWACRMRSRRRRGRRVATRRSVAVASTMYILRKRATRCSAIKRDTAAPDPSRRHCNRKHDQEQGWRPGCTPRAPSHLRASELGWVAFCSKPSFPPSNPRLCFLAAGGRCRRTSYFPDCCAWRRVCCPAVSVSPPLDRHHKPRSFSVFLLVAPVRQGALRAVFRVPSLLPLRGLAALPCSAGCRAVRGVLCGVCSAAIGARAL